MKKLTTLLITLLSITTGYASLPACNTIISQTLCNKIGQMLIVGFGGFKQNVYGDIVFNDKNGAVFKSNSLIGQYIKDNHVGGVILFERNAIDIRNGKHLRPRNIESPQQLATLNQDLQNYNNKTRQQQDLIPLPLLISVDQEGGHTDRLPGYLNFRVSTLNAQAFGSKETLAKTNKQKQFALNESQRYFTRLAKELKDLHFNVDFAPVVDVNINPTNPIIGGLGRSFSSNPKIVVNQASIMIKALEKNGIIPVIKHFPGHGSSKSDSHLGLVDVTKTYKKDQELYPYQQLINNHFDGMIMTTHVINGQLDKTQCRKGNKNDHQTWCPGTMSKKTLTGLLRQQLGYQGIIISDDMTMRSIAGQYSLAEAFQKSINAGVDMFIVSNNQTDETALAISTIAKLVIQGKISAKQIDRANQRIVKEKKKLST